MATIQEIAQRAGTSVATVSHVINRTRFVSEDLRKRVERAMEELGYHPQDSRKIIVGFLLRNYRCSFAEDLIDALHCCSHIKAREELSYQAVCPGNIEVVSILVKTELTMQELKTYQKRYGLDYIILDYTVRMAPNRHHETVEAPIIFLNHDPKIYPKCYHINFDYRSAMVAALRHMVSLGHRNILVITPRENPYTNRLVLETCKLFYKQNNMVFPDENLVEIETYLFRTLALENLEQVLGALQSRGITGIITTEMMATMHVVDYLRHRGLNMPQDVSLLAIGDIFLTKYLFFNRTRIDMRILEVVQDIVSIVQGDGRQRFYSISPEFITGDSTKALVFDQFDRPGASQLSLELSEAEIQKVRAGDYKVCVSTFMESTPVSHSQLEGLRDGLNTLGIHMVHKTDAHGNYEIQNLQLQGFAAAKPDAVICIPNLDENDVSPFKKHLPRRTKVLFSSCVPDQFTANLYDCCIAGNMVESGKQASWLLGKYMTANGLTHAAYLCYGGNSQPARHRDRSAISILEEEFPLITLDRVVYYTEETQAYTMVSDLLRELPQIEAMYISQSRMAEAVLGVLSLLGRTDIKVVTQGVSKEVIDQLDDHSNVIGVVVPNSYEIGRLLAYACAHYFLGMEPSPFVAVDPVAFTPQNLSGAWLSVMKNKLT